MNNSEWVRDKLIFFTRTFFLPSNMHVNLLQLICVQEWPAVMEEPVRSEAAPV